MAREILPGLDTPPAKGRTHYGPRERKLGQRVSLKVNTEKGSQIIPRTVSEKDMGEMAIGTVTETTHSPKKNRYHCGTGRTQEPISTITSESWVLGSAAEMCPNGIKVENYIGRLKLGRLEER